MKLIEDKLTRIKTTLERYKNKPYLSTKDLARQCGISYYTFSTSEEYRDLFIEARNIFDGIKPKKAIKDPRDEARDEAREIDDQIRAYKNSRIDYWDSTLT